MHDFFSQANAPGVSSPGVAESRYKWVALTNTTLGVLMSALNGSIILIALPAIFRGIQIDPMAPGETTYLLWMLMSYMLITATLLVSFGRISDILGRVRLYNLGFAIFTVASILLFLNPAKGNTAAAWLIGFRVLQGVGGGFLFANSAAIITDAFPPGERGMAMGLNQIAGIGGSLIGLILGGILAAINWRGVFLVSVPIGIAGTIWAYLMLKEKGDIRQGQRIDWLGNTVFAIGLFMLLISLTYSIMPYGDSPTGWGNPLVREGVVGGLLLLLAFLFIETRVSNPMFRLDLFRIRMFWAGNLSGFLSSIAWGGLQFMLIIWLQGIWLPLHGYNFEDTPLYAGIYMIPMMAFFLLSGPLCGRLSDRYGARGFSTGGMLLAMVGFLLLIRLPANFSYGAFMIILAILGVGMGMFSAPNMSSIMNSVPADARGVSAGMRATFQNSATLLSMVIFFSIAIVGLGKNLPPLMSQKLVEAGLPLALASKIATLPPTAALFDCFLGYNPLGQLIPSEVLVTLPQSVQATVLSKEFFPGVIAPAFMSSLHIAFYLSAALSLIAAVASFSRGHRYVHGQ